VSWRRLLLIILVTTGATSFFLSFPYFYTLERNSPHAPTAQESYELNDHGYVFHVTREQYYLFRIMVEGGWALGVLAALLNLRWKVIHNLGPKGWHLPK
jgi:hypothetical protein